MTFFLGSNMHLQCGICNYAICMWSIFLILKAYSICPMLCIGMSLSIGEHYQYAAHWLVVQLFTFLCYFSPSDDQTTDIASANDTEDDYHIYDQNGHSDYTNLQRFFWDWKFPSPLESHPNSRSQSSLLVLKTNTFSDENAFSGAYL